MSRVLQLTTYGMKNIENPLTIDFANATLEAGIKKLNTVKGIFGYNGSGKSALISSVDLYKKIICNYNYLLQNETISQLDKLINYKVKEFYIQMIYEYNKNSAIKHNMKIVKDKITNTYIIEEEEIGILNGRTINDAYKIILKRIKSELLSMDNQVIDNYNSIIFSKLKYLIQSKGIKEQKNELDEYARILLKLLSNANNIEIYLVEQDQHKNLRIERNYILGFLESSEDLKKLMDSEPCDIYVDDDEIYKEDYERYLDETKKLEKFIQLFKPELAKIELKVLEDKNICHIRKIFCYQEYKVELEYESSGLRQLVKLFTYLMKCAKGAIAFIDEIDTNMNTGYLKKLISFFKTYGKGQLIFTTHNVETMEVLKSQAKSISVIGVENKLEVWVGKGNKSPVNDYLEGFFTNSPMNIEDFDFVNIFLGED